MSRTFTEDFSQAKRDEVLALEMVKRLGDIEHFITGSSEEDRAGIDAWIKKDGQITSCDVKTYTFDWKVIRLSGWWKSQQQVVIEIQGGVSSQTYSGDGANWILYHWRCLNPFIVGLDETKRLIQAGFQTHMWLERDFCFLLTQAWEDIPLNIRHVTNTEGAGSMLLIGAQDIQTTREIWLNELKTVTR